MSTPAASSVPRATPALRDGDRLTRDEFERRYDARPTPKGAELIEGVVYMPPPVRHNHHGRPHSRLVGWLIAHEAATPGVEASDNGGIRLGSSHEPQPDAHLPLPAHCGRTRISDDDSVEGAPELVAEVAPSSVRHDLGPKLDADGLFKSAVFPGRWLDPKALLAGDLARVLAVLGRGTASAEHAAFVKNLEAPTT